MADLVVVATVVAFFGLSAMFVRACDRIIGADEQVTKPAEREARAA